MRQPGTIPPAPRVDRFVDAGIVSAAGERISVKARLLESAPVGSAVVTIPATVDESGLGRELASAGMRGGFAVCDASHQDHLRAIAGVTEGLDPGPLLAGAAGLAEAVAGLHGGEVARSAHAFDPARRVLFVLGSLYPRVPIQLELLTRTRPVGCVSLSELRSARCVHKAARHGSVVVESIRSAWPAADGGTTARALARAAAALLAAEEFDAVLCAPVDDVESRSELRALPCVGVHGRGGLDDERPPDGVAAGAAHDSRKGRFAW